MKMVDIKTVQSHDEAAQLLAKAACDNVVNKQLDFALEQIVSGQKIALADGVKVSASVNYKPSWLGGTFDVFFSPLAVLNLQTLFESLSAGKEAGGTSDLANSSDKKVACNSSRAIGESIGESNDPEYFVTSLLGYIEKHLSVLPTLGKAHREGVLCLQYGKSAMIYYQFQYESKVLDVLHIKHLAENRSGNPPPLFDIASQFSDSGRCH